MFERGTARNGPARWRLALVGQFGNVEMMSEKTKKKEEQEERGETEQKGTTTTMMTTKTTTTGVGVYTISVTRVKCARALLVSSSLSLFLRESDISRC